jgi:recombinational DNA repair ATPase RecF
MPAWQDVGDRRWRVDVRGRLDGVDGEVTTLVEAAVAGDDHLAALLADGTTPPVPSDADDGVRGERAVLERIDVRGFRGIGSEASLRLPPGPGLTLVVGRNGSGKSSFAEAAELALTGANARWDRRSKVWRDGWRNLHHPAGTRVRATFVTPGRNGRTVVERRWADDAKLDDATSHVHTPDGASDLDSLGWRTALEVSRPFLPYSELGAMVDEGPTSLHDALAAVLGLDELTDGAKRLRDARLARERAWKATAAAGVLLADELDELADDDPRATAAVEQLRAKRPDLDALADLVAGTAPDVDRQVALLRELAGLRGPDLDAVRAVARELDDAVAEAADHAGTDAARDLEVADLLARARAHHAEHGDGPCPVCGAAPLDETWADAAARREEQLRSGAAAVQGAQQRLDAAVAAVRRLVGPAPGALARAGVVGVEPAEALAAYEAWAGVPDVPARERLSALLTAADTLAARVAEVRGEAGRLLQAREDRWRPLAVRVARWVDEAREARAATSVCDDLRAAEKALAGLLDEVRRERWTPIAAQARAIWDQLRQRSNVSVDEVALAGSGVKRRVEVQVTVDGVEGAALGVMSQGELHALALSLFLPRATLPESPFGFVVLDDPVQSMDPARVDGLARVLETVAADRQVVVFTHDDRLPEAVRRLGIPASVLEVARGTDSRVEVRETSAPWRRHLDDAAALARSEPVPELVRRRTVPGFCRLALEAAALDRYRATALGEGATHDEVEQALAGATTLVTTLALGLFGDARRGGDVYPRLDRRGRWAADAVRACNRGSHAGFDGDPVALVDDVRELIEKELA